MLSIPGDALTVKKAAEISSTLHKNTDGEHVYSQFGFRVK